MINITNNNYSIKFEDIPEEWIWKKNKILPSICNNWEQDFMVSIYSRFRHKNSRSHKQNNVIKKLQYKSRLEKIPDKLPEEKPKINPNMIIPHDKSVKIIKAVVNKFIGKGWDSYTKLEQKFIENISIRIQQPGAELNGEELTKIKEIIYSTKNRNYRYNRFVGRRLREDITYDKTGSRDTVVKITAVKKMRNTAILCDLVIIKNWYKELMENEWVPIRQIF